MAPVLALLIGGTLGGTYGTYVDTLSSGRHIGSPISTPGADRSLYLAYRTISANQTVAGQLYPAFTATPTPTATLDPPAVPAPMVTPPPGTPAGPDGTIAAFTAGYLDAGGPPEYLDHLINDVVPCEWGWEPWYPGNGYLTRAQFDPGSWENAGGGDYTDEYQVGANVGRWVTMVDPGSSAGWPWCWWQ